jgi:hypothetical protein
MFSAHAIEGLLIVPYDFVGFNGVCLRLCSLASHSCQNHAVPKVTPSSRSHLR